MSDRGVEDVDLLVIGGGKAGKSLAMDRAKAGWKVAMVERDKIGATCINVGVHSHESAGGGRPDCTYSSPRGCAGRRRGTGSPTSVRSRGPESVVRFPGPARHDRRAL